MSVAAGPRRPPGRPKQPPPTVVRSPRVERLARELASAPDATARFWEEARREGTPLVEPAPAADERIVTFLWRDQGGEATAEKTVALLANKLTDPSVWEESRLERLAGTDVWHRSYLLRADWRATYQLAVADPGEAELAGSVAGPMSRWRGLVAAAGPDPLNPARFPARDGGAELSVVALPEAPPQPWCAGRPGVESGVVRETTIESRALGEARRVWVRKPVRPGSAGLLVLLDGEDWVGRLGAPAILDNLEAEDRIAPVVAVMVDSLDRDRRWRDLSCAPDFIEFLSAELVPWVGERRELDRRRIAIAGQSLGGLTALCAATRAPDVWSGAIAQSSSLWLAPDGAGEGVGWDFAEIADRPPTGARLRVEVGRQEWVLLADHRRLRDLLTAAGVAVEYVEYEGGHDAICWRGGLAEALLDQFPADAG